jgi:hypothetical protein
MAKSKSKSMIQQRTELKEDQENIPTAERLLSEDKIAVYFLKIPEALKTKLKHEALDRRWSLNKYIVEILKVRGKVLTGL